MTLEEEYKKWMPGGGYQKTSKMMDELNNLKIEEKYSETAAYLQLKRSKRDLIKEYYQILDGNQAREHTYFVFYKTAGTVIDEINQFNGQASHSPADTNACVCVSNKIMELMLLFSVVLLLIVITYNTRRPIFTKDDNMLLQEF